jgi:hypothetical protein
MTGITSMDIARCISGNQVHLVYEKYDHRFSVAGMVEFRFFGRLINDCLGRTETVMTQAQAFKAAGLLLRAQAVARRIV